MKSWKVFTYLIYINGLTKVSILVESQLHEVYIYFDIKSNELKKRFIENGRRQI